MYVVCIHRIECGHIRQGRRTPSSSPFGTRPALSTSCPVPLPPTILHENNQTGAAISGAKMTPEKASLTLYTHDKNFRFNIFFISVAIAQSNNNNDDVFRRGGYDSEVNVPTRGRKGGRGGRCTGRLHRYHIDIGVGATPFSVSLL